MIEVDKFFLNESASIKDAISVIDKGAAQVALVVDCNRKLKGVVTDGDVRRAILLGKSLENNVKTIMTSSPISLNVGSSRNKAFKVIKKYNLHHLPVIDSSGRIVELLLLDDFLISREFTNPVVIMAGGKGKRLGPLTQNSSKPMLEIGGQPMMEIVLRRCVESGFKRFFISVNHFKDEIIDYFQTGEKWGVEISYLEESQPLGTCGALSLLPKSINEEFLVINCDILTDLDVGRLLDFHKQSKNCLTICVRKHRVHIPYGVINARNSKLDFLVEKPTYDYDVNAGVYLLNPSLIDRIPEEFFDMTDLINQLLESNEGVGVFPIFENWQDVGTPEDFNEALFSFGSGEFFK